eukprot:scaffold4724_cov108-Cylindrotheca_fusiformis.AAC.4
MKSPPVLQQNDEDAAAEAARARQNAQGIVRDHLNNHVVHNKGAGSDYVSWIATLHPENAEVTIDQRFLVPGNPWWAIYDQTVNNLPLATAIAVPEEEYQHYSQDDEEEGRRPGTGSAGATKRPQDRPPVPHFLLRCNPVDLFCGLLIIFHALLATLIAEGLALAFYIVAAIAYHVAQCFGNSNPLTGIVYSFCMIFYFAFALADTILLFASVMATELVDLLGWFFSFLTGGIWVANRRHQFIRRICHSIRCALRHPNLNPPRDFLLSSRAAKDKRKDDAARRSPSCPSTSRGRVEVAPVMEAQVKMDSELAA